VGSLVPGTVHLWFLDASVPSVPTWLDVLDAEEQERARTLRTADLREAFVASHALVRTALSAYADRVPAEWRFDVAPLGRPSIVDAPSGLRFSLTHAGSAAAVAITVATELGLDMETVRPDRDPLPLARRFFSASEAEALVRLPERERPDAFTRLWTVKEAVLKAQGCGLTAPLSSVAVQLDAAGWPRTVDASGGPWSVHAWSPESGLVVALAVVTDQPLSITAFRTAPLGQPRPAPGLAPTPRA
jgi:4'-phosphopantetheinyl transferase